MVTRRQLPQRAGLPGVNGGGAATMVPPTDRRKYSHTVTVKPKNIHRSHICCGGFLWILSLTDYVITVVNTIIQT